MGKPSGRQAPRSGRGPEMGVGLNPTLLISAIYDLRRSSWLRRKLETPHRAVKTTPIRGLLPLAALLWLCYVKHTLL